MQRESESGLARLQSMPAFAECSEELLRDLNYFSFYEYIDKGTMLFRQDDLATNWYILLSGSIDVITCLTGRSEDTLTVCSLSEGCIFGEHVLRSCPTHSTSAITRTFVELLRIDGQDFIEIWKYAKQLKQHTDLVLLKTAADSFIEGSKGFYERSLYAGAGSKKALQPNPSVRSQRLLSNFVVESNNFHSQSYPSSPSCSGSSAPSTSLHCASSTVDIALLRRRAHSSVPERVRDILAKNDLYNRRSNPQGGMFFRNNAEKKGRQLPGNYSYTLPLFNQNPVTNGTSAKNWNDNVLQSTGKAVSFNDEFSHSQFTQPHSGTASNAVERGASSSKSQRMQNNDTSNFPISTFPLDFSNANSLSDRRLSVDSHHVNLRPKNTSVTELADEVYDSVGPVYAQGFLQTSDNEVESSTESTAAAVASSRVKLLQCGARLKQLMYNKSPNMIRDRKFQLTVYSESMVGTELVDWIIENSSKLIQSRQQAVGVWQAFLEEGIISHVTHEYPFLDKHLFYRWCDDKLIGCEQDIVNEEELQENAENELTTIFNYLALAGPDALFRMILQKAPHDRQNDDLEVVYEELLHIKALSHLSTMVKRELASVLMFEQHQNAGTVLFSQGDEGKSWYIILKGSVQVIIYGKGVVCTLHEGDDFGKLALVNDAPRAASIVLNEDNCQFLRVDKDDFNRILRDVEANTVRLKEHGKDVLVLEKIPVNSTVKDASTARQHRYSVMAGSPEKMLEYLLETRLDALKDESSDTFLEDFILTHIIFMPINVLCSSLMVYYQQGCLAVTCSLPGEELAVNTDHLLVAKRRVIAFLQKWGTVARTAFFQNAVAASFLEELYCTVLEDGRIYGNSLARELEVMQELMHSRERAMQANTRKPCIVMDCGVLRQDRQDTSVSSLPVMSFDLSILKVYSHDLMHTAIKTRMDRTVAQVSHAAAHKLGIGKDCGIELVEMRSNGEKIIFHADETSIATMLTPNGRLFAVFREHLEYLVPLPDQDGPTESVHSSTLDSLSPTELANHLAHYHWELFVNTHEYEFIYHVIGRDKFSSDCIPSNLDLLMRRFNEVQYWVATEVVLCQNLPKRVNLIKKFIKIASVSRQYQDLLSFFAIILGLSNVAISRLSLTWEKLSAKYRKLFVDFENYLDPSRNHRAYRLMVSKMQPPQIPFVPLLMKDLTFTHEGNKTYFDGLVNFEKMHMVGQTLRNVRTCRSCPFTTEVSGAKKSTDLQHLIRNFKVIDNQRRLAQLSQKIEPRKSVT